MRRTAAAWNRFWFAPAPASTLAVLRIAVGLLAVATGRLIYQHHLAKLRCHEPAVLE